MRTVSPVLVGRAGELRVLDAALAPGRPDGPSVVLIGGEAGVGKSRLVSEFTIRARASGVRVLTGGCVELGTDGLPFAPFTAVLRELVRDLGVGGVGGLLPGGVTRDFARLLPEFGAADGDAGESVARARLFEQMLALLERLADGGGVVLVIEDAHWADRSTRDLLAFLVSRQQVLDRALIIVTYRSDELHRTHPVRPLLAELGRLAWVERMELPRLDRRHADELVARILGHEPEAWLADEVYRRADGNPLFVEELLCDDCGGGLVAGMPESLRDLLLVSMRRLPDETQEVLRTAAAGGQHVGHALLAAVTGLSDHDLSRALRPAVAANVLTADADGYAFRHGLIREAVLDDMMPGDHTRLHTRFAQALETDPGLVPPGRAVIEQAHHWYAAHEITGALVSGWRAAAEAGRALAHAEQLTLLGRVLELWAKVPDAEQRIGATRVSVLEQAARVARTAGENERGAAYAAAALKEIDPAAEPVRAALLMETQAVLGRYNGADELHEKLQAALDLVPPGTGDAARARILVNISRCAGKLRGPEAAAAIDEALTLAERVGDAATQATALLEFGLIRSNSGDDTAAMEVFARAQSVAARAGAYEPQLWGAINESHVLEGFGRHEKAAEVACAGIVSSEDYGLARSSGTFLAINVAEPLVSLGRWDEAIEVIEHALALAPEQNIRSALRQLAGEIALRRGDLADARDHAAAARRALDRAATKHRGQLDIPLTRLEVELRLAEGESAAALAVVAAVDGRLDLTDEPRYSWPLLAVAARAAAAVRAAATSGVRPAAQAGDLLTRLTDLAARMPAHGPVQRAGRLAFSAEALRAQDARTPGAGPARETAAEEIAAAFDAVAAAWERVGDPYPRAVALLGAGEASLAAGDRDRAAVRLRHAAELAGELGARPLLTQVEALQRSGRIVPDGDRAGQRAAVTPFGLTARESDVLRLVADGRSNPEIAARLFISVKTASVHVSNILAKMGVAHRGAAAAEAHRLHLFDAAATS